MSEISYEVWNQFSPTAFENFCLDIISRQNIDADLDVEKTETIRDGGIDLIIRTNSTRLNLFSYSVAAPFLSMCEVKRRKKTDLHSFARSLIRLSKEKGCKCFVLITTSKINLSTFFELKEYCEENRLSFYYIHKDILSRYVIENSYIAQRYKFNKVIPEWNDIKNTVLADINCHWAYSKMTFDNRIYVNDIISIGKRNREITIKKDEKISIPVVIENFHKNLKEIEVTIYGIDKWSALQSSSRQWIINPESFKAFEFTFELNANLKVKLPEIHFEEVINNKTSSSTFVLTIHANNLIVSPHYVSPFSGTEPKKHKFDLERMINPINNHNNTYNWIIIEGQAGVGKSRLVEESIIKNIHKASERFFIEEKNDWKNIKSIYKTLINNYTDLVHKANIQKTISSIDSRNITDDNITSLANLFKHKPLDPLIIIIEDIHHGSDLFYKWINHLINISIDIPNWKYTICITGRNDETFPNPLQYTLRETLINLDESKKLFVGKFELLPLSEDDAGSLVYSIFNGITNEAVNHILKLSDNIPFNLLQIIEFLTEEQLIEINNRNTYSINNEGEFYRKIGLPLSMKDILSLRISNLINNIDDNKILDLLFSIVLLGFQITKNNFETLVNLYECENYVWILFERNFLKKSDDGEGVRFSHENLLHYFNELLIEDNIYLRRIANNLQENFNSISDVEMWKKSNIYFHAGLENEVLKFVYSIIGKGSVSDLFYGGNLPKKQSILSNGVQVLYERAELSNQEALLLLNLYRLRAFASKYTKNYFDTIKEGVTSLQAINKKTIIRTNISEDIYDISCASIEQIVGHAYQNAGYIDKSQYHIQKAQRITWQYPSLSPMYLDLKFDVEDRLRKNFIYLGEFDDAKRSFKAANEAIIQKKDKLLLGSAMYGEAELYYLQNPQKAYDIWKKIKSQIETYSDNRTIITYSLVLIQMELLFSKEKDQIEEILSKLKELGDESIKAGLIGPLPKINLLNGFAYYKLGNFEKAIFENIAAYEKAEKYGYGIYLWFSMNNLALILQEQNNNKVQDICQAYETAISKADKQGFLKYLNSEKPLFFQYALVKNALGFYNKNNLIKHKKILLTILEKNSVTNLNLEIKPSHEIFLVNYGTYFLFI